MKKLKGVLLAALLFAVFIMLSSGANAEVHSGWAGRLSWSLDSETGVLLISGATAMMDYSYSSRAPWYDYRDDITSITIDSGVTTIGDYAILSVIQAAFCALVNTHE